MFYVTRTCPTEFDLVGPFKTKTVAKRWADEARSAANDLCTLAVFRAGSEPVFCTITDPATGEPRLGGDLPDSLAVAPQEERRL